MCIVQSHIAVLHVWCVQNAIATAQSMIDSRGVFGSANNATDGFALQCIVAMVMVVHVCTKYHSHTQATMQ